MNVNYQILLDESLNQIMKSGKTPSLLLHSCCAPCSSYVIEYLSRYFAITVFYYNPNISPEDEYRKREETQKEFLRGSEFINPVSFLQGDYDEELFLRSVQGYEAEREGGARCEKCFCLRLRETAKTAKEEGFDYFCTTLSVSPHKNAQLINKIGFELEKELGISFLPADFKKRGGYQRSIELSKQYGLYRQDYCGCRFSLEEKNNDH